MSAPANELLTADGLRRDQVVRTGEMLVRIASPTDIATQFCAGVIYDSGRDQVTRTALILKYLLGIDAERLREVSKANRWKTTIVKIGE